MSTTKKEFVHYIVKTIIFPMNNLALDCINIQKICMKYTEFPDIGVYMSKNNVFYRIFDILLCMFIKEIMAFRDSKM